MALSLIVALSLSAAQTPAEPAQQLGAPAAPPNARYCLRTDPITGSRMELVRCETRADWAAMDVDVDAEWAKWGVRVVTTTPGYGA